MLAFQRHETDAFEVIYRRYAPRVRLICRRALIDNGDAQEATQETFLKAYRYLGSFRGTYELGAWLARIASNVCIDQVRRNVRVPRSVPLAPEHESLSTPKGIEDLSLSDSSRLDDATHRLAPQHSLALRLRLVGGYSYKEMAAELDLSPAQVKALLHRARRALKRAWGESSARGHQEILQALEDSGVLGRFLGLPDGNRTQFLTLISRGTTHDLRHHRTETLISALQKSPYGNAEFDLLVTALGAVV